MDEDGRSMKKRGKMDLENGESEEEKVLLNNNARYHTK